MKNLILFLTFIFGMNGFAVYNKAMQKAYKTSEEMTDKNVKDYEDATGEKINDPEFEKEKEKRDSQRLGRYSQPVKPKAAVPVPVVITPPVPKKDVQPDVPTTIKKKDVQPDVQLLDDSTISRILAIRVLCPDLWIEYCKVNPESKNKMGKELKDSWILFIVGKYDTDKDGLLSEKEFSLIGVKK